MAERLPTVGGDTNTWGTVLNGFLGEEHTAAGKHSSFAGPLTIAGNVGIGTESPSNGGGFGRVLDIYGSSSSALSLSSGAKNFQIGLNTSDALGFYDATNSAYRLYIQTGGNVGIGTATPTTGLNVVSDGASLAGVTAQVDIAVSGSQAANKGGALVFGTGSTRYGGISAFSATGSQDGYLSLYTRPSTGNLTEWMRITSDGNVGIGTAAPTNMLTLNEGSAKIWMATDDPYLMLSSGGSLSSPSEYWITRIDNSDSDKFQIKNSGSSVALTINTSNQVGIGTISPTAILDVRPSPRETIYDEEDYSTWSDIHCHNLTTIEGAATGISFSVYDTEQVNSSAGIAAVGMAGNAETDLAFITRPLSAASQERMRITSSGDVGIGTSSPDAKLEVESTNATAWTGSNITSVELVRIYNPSNTLSTVSMIHLSSGSTGTINCGIGAFRESSGVGGLVFATDNAAIQESMRITGAGDVGIGTTSPDYKCHVNGTFGCAPGSSVTPANNGDVVIQATSNTSLTFKLKGSDGVVRSGSVTLA